MNPKPVNITDRIIGPGHPCFIIAEAGVNHNGNLEVARQMVDAAVKVGADAIKFQTYATERLVTTQAPKADYQAATTGAHESQYDMLRRLELSKDAHRDLMAYCRKKGILFLSSPFDKESADFLDELGVVAFKVPSGELTNLPLLMHIARKQKPMIVSTGMADLEEVKDAVRVIESIGNRGYILLHCVSGYPAAPKDINLRAMQTLAAACKCPVGYSDHTSGIEVALAAVAIGACVIEKHFTLDCSLPGPDQSCSLEPGVFATLVRGIRTVELALGNGAKKPAACEKNVADVARKSLVAARDIPAGAGLGDHDIAVKRPGTGLPPSRMPELIGRTARLNIPIGTVLSMDMLK